MSKIDNSVKITGMIVLAVVILAVLGFYVINPVSANETIRSDGVSTVTVIPDKVSIYFSVETSGTTAAEAKDLNTETANKVIDAIIGEGFERKDIETTSFNVYEDIEWTERGRVSKGYKATHSLRVKFSAEESEKIGKVIDAGIDSGALLSYISFELSQELENQYKAEALKLATEDARTKAEAIATGLGAKLGKVVSVSSSEASYYPSISYDARAMEESVSIKGSEIATSIQPGEREITGRVSVIYKIN
ncbi:MAG: SIMPL domain-containing protein [Candidatus Pacearchaeota archaeon]